MKTSDLAVMVRGVVPILREYIALQTTGMWERIGEMEKRVASLRDGRDGEQGPPGDRGEKGEPGEPGAVGPQGTPGDRGPNGDSGESGAQGLPGEKGLDGAAGLNGKDGERGEQGSAGVPGLDGAPGRDGKDGEIGHKGADGLPGLDGKDGIDGTNGQDGPSGRDGLDGKSVTVEDVRPLLEAEIARAELDLERRAGDVFQRAIDRIPPPKDGQPGAPGADGLNFDELEAVFDDYGRMSLQATRGGVVVKSFRVPGIVDRGVYRAGETYLKGDGATFGGSFWIAQKDTTAKPGDPLDDPKAWRLAVKQGREGKQGPPGPKPGGSA